MKILLIPDKFKGSLSAREVISTLEEAISSVKPDAQFYPVMASDGGDGFLDAIANYKAVERITHATSDPLGRELQAAYLYDAQTREAYVELAQASGLVLLKEEERSALHTSTFGTGQQIKHAIEQGARIIYLGLGGSATNDGGTGIAAALGYRFLDREGGELHPSGARLQDIDRIDASGVPHTTMAVSFTAVNDVNNPLFGPMGAAHVYAEQKGADTGAIKILDNGLRHLHRLVESQLGKNLAEVPGTGAAGGTSYGLKAFFGAEFISGIHFILQMAGIPDILKAQKLDYIVTGEGKIDRQTLSGKLINGVLTLGKQYDIPVIGVCGMLDVSLEELKKEGISDVIEIRDPDQSLEFNMRHASSLLKKAVAAYFQHF